MSKLNKMPDYSSAKSRSLHDMSHDFAFTLPCGPLVPIEHDILLPGDKIEVKTDFNVRNILPFDAPAGVDFDFHVDYFFVPMELIYKPFATYVYGQNDEWSSMFGSYDVNGKFKIDANIKLPLLDSEDFYKYITSLIVVPDDRHFESRGKQMQRLLDHFGFPVFDDNVLNDHYTFGTVNMDYPICPNFFPWMFCAYQTIYEKYFRIEEYEAYSPIFNIDKYYKTSLIQPTQSVDDGRMINDLTMLRYRPLYKDYFTSVKANPMYNDLNQNQSILNSLDFVKSQGLNKFPNSNTLSHLGLKEYEDSTQLSFTSGESGFYGDLANLNAYDDGEFGSIQYGQNSVNQLRALFATEKLLYVTQRAGKNYDDQTLAHFGIKVPHDVKHDLSHLGHTVHTMHIGEVTSLADTGDAGRALGSYAGKGYLNTTIQGFGKNKEIKFTAPCHGVFMAIFSCVPRVSYNVPVLKKNIVQTRLDLFQPEFDHLGMQPIFRYELDMFTKAYKIEDSGNIYLNKGNSLDETFMSQIVGWQYRYEEKKRQFNRVSAAFQKGSMSPWFLSVSPLSTFKKYVGNIVEEEGESDVYVVEDHGTSVDSLYCSPRITDGIFSANYAMTFEPIDEQFDTDPFMINSRVSYKKISIMSTYSMPKLD